MTLSTATKTSIVHGKVMDKKSDVVDVFFISDHIRVVSFIGDDSDIIVYR